MEFKYSSNVRNTLENVWDFAMDIERRPEWIHFFEKCYFTEKKSNWIGSKYKEKSVFLGIPLYIEFTILDYTHQQSMIAHSNMPPFFPTIKISASDNGDGTIYSALEFDMKLGPFFLLPKRLIRKQVDNLINPFVDRFIEIMDQP